MAHEEGTTQPAAAGPVERPVRPCEYNNGTCARRGCVGVCQALQLCQPTGLKFDAFGAPRKRYVRVTLDGSHCVMDASEGDRYLQDAKESHDSALDRYVLADVWLSEREFDDLPEFDGF